MDPYPPEVMRHVRWALLEGFNVYRTKCMECGYDWPRAIVPGTLVGMIKCPECKLPTGRRYWQVMPHEVS